MTAGGRRAIDAGPLRRARQLEHLGFLHMALQESLGSGYASAVTFAMPDASRRPHEGEEMGAESNRR